MQQLLDTILERAPQAARARFAASLTMDAHPSAGLHVAIAIVQRKHGVLLVQRRDGDLLSWQFPAGIVKPESSAPRVAVHETRTETGIDCAVARELGSRTHPITGVFCVYYLCEYLAGEATNLDIVENASVTWANARDLCRFIPTARIFPPILDAIGVAA